jgi:hypothetical protein
VDEGISLKPVEIKFGQTIAPDFMTSLKKWCKLSGTPDRPAVRPPPAQTPLLQHFVTLGCKAAMGGRLLVQV